MMAPPLPGNSASTRCATGRGSKIGKASKTIALSAEAHFASAADASGVLQASAPPAVRRRNCRLFTFTSFAPTCAAGAVTAGTFKARVTVRKVALSVSLRCASCELRTLDLREAHGSVTVECYPKPASSLWGARLAITCGLAKNRRVGVAIQQDRGRKLDRRQQMQIPGAWARDLIVGVHGGNLFGSDRALRAFIAERTVFMQRTKRGGRRWDSPACVCRCWERDIGVTYPVSRIMVTSTQVFQ